MRTRTLSRNPEGVGWGFRIFIAIVAVLILGAVGLAVYAGTITPPRHSIERILPNDHFAG